MIHTPVPGDNHPAVTDFAPVLREDRPYLFRVAVPPKLSATNAPNSAVMAPDSQVLEFTAERAAQSLYPEYGHYTWLVWRDQYGRHVTEPKATWVENPQGFMYGEWNPGVEAE